MITTDGTDEGALSSSAIPATEPRPRSPACLLPTLLSSTHPHLHTDQVSVTTGLHGTTVYCTPCRAHDSRDDM